MASFLLIFVVAAPLWLPVAFLIYHISTARPVWQFSLRFLFVLIVAECVALAVSVAVDRWADWVYRNMPVPG